MKFLAPVAVSICMTLAGPVRAGVGTAPVQLPPDAETTVNGVAVACTGVGQTRSDPRWSAYPSRVEFSNARNEYLTEGEASIFDKAGRLVLAVRCEGPWILLKLAPGDYRVEGRLPDTQAKPRSAAFRPPATGQQRLVLQFPDL